ncbi:hypothetical protein B0A48_08829 [Cryoendolithus antarcticus]|uniref:Uncharacterized protein n=1 Tax=Cryoendolithus antarcticus TaxID=1507870 RepID=A0A1V8T4R8_9PEZI|nr:hypothetical protein B0A48_08829 [Cryoendolithus antarcticus]
MGTRHLVCIYYQGRFVVSWSRSTVNSMAFLRFIAIPDNIRKHKLSLPHIVVLSESGTPGLSPDFRKALTYSPTSLKEYHDIFNTPASFVNYASTDILSYIAKADAKHPVQICRWLSFANADMCEYSKAPLHLMTKPKGQGTLWKHLPKGKDSVDLMAKFALSDLPAEEKFLDACNAGSDRSMGPGDSKLGEMQIGLDLVEQCAASGKGPKVVLGGQ